MNYTQKAGIASFVCFFVGLTQCIPAILITLPIALYYLYKMNKEE